MNGHVTGTFLQRWRRLIKPLFGWAAAFAAWAIAGWAASGGETLSRLGLRPLPLVVWYFGMALMASLLIAALHPWATSRTRGAAIGVAGGLLIAGTLWMFVVTLPLPLWAKLGSVATMGAFGAIIGAMYWEKAGRPTTQG